MSETISQTMTTHATSEPSVDPTLDHRRRFDAGSFVAGVVFLVIGVAFALEAAGTWEFELGDLRFIGPTFLIVIGLSTLLSGVVIRSDR